MLEKGNKIKETKQHLHLIYLFYLPCLDLVPRVGGSVELLIPGSLCKAFDLRTNGLAQRIHLVVQIHPVDLGLHHPLIHVVEPEFDSSELLMECGDVVLLLLLLVAVRVGVDLRRTPDRCW